MARLALFITTVMQHASLFELDEVVFIFRARRNNSFAMNNTYVNGTSKAKCIPPIFRKMLQPRAGDNVVLSQQHHGSRGSGVSPLLPLPPRNHLRPS